MPRNTHEPKAPKDSEESTDLGRDLEDREDVDADLAADELESDRVSRAEREEIEEDELADEDIVDMYEDSDRYDEGPDA